MRISSIHFYTNFGTKRQFKKMFNTCCYSGEKFEIHNTKTIEHIVPLSQGGKNEYANYLVVKRSWNQKRSSYSLKDFINSNPDVKQNIIKSVNEQQGKVIDGVNWSEEVKKTLINVLGEDIFKS